MKNFLEKNLEDIIHKTPQKFLEERGLHFGDVIKMWRQLSIGNYGIADLVILSKTGPRSFDVDVYELKQNEVDMNTFKQALGYLRGIKSYIDARYENEYFISYSITLIGSKTSGDAVLYLPEFSNEYFGIRIFTYSYEFDGIKFHCEDGYSLIHEVGNRKFHELGLIRAKQSRKQDLPF